MKSRDSSPFEEDLLGREMIQVAMKGTRILEPGKPED